MSRFFKIFAFPVIILFLSVFSIITFIMLTAACLVKIIGEAWLTLRAIYED